MPNERKQKNNLRLVGHVYFDLIVRYKAYRTRGSIRKWRNKQYRWLAKKLNISRDDCHFSSMGDELCRKAIDLMALEFAKNDKLLQFAEEYESGQFKYQNSIISSKKIKNKNSDKFKKNSK